MGLNGDDEVLFVRASTRSRTVVVVASLGASPVILVGSKEKWDVSDVRLDLFFCLLYYITVIMLHGRPNIPTVNSMGIPWFSLSWFFMNNDLMDFSFQGILIVIEYILK